MAYNVGKPTFEVWTYAELQKGITPKLLHVVVSDGVEIVSKPYADVRFAQAVAETFTIMYATAPAEYDVITVERLTIPPVPEPPKSDPEPVRKKRKYVLRNPRRIYPKNLY